MRSNVAPAPKAASIVLQRSDFRALAALNHLHPDTLTFLECG